MANTPLELYETAYKLQYIDKKIAKAVAAYKQLVREFPDSNECGYAVIQLQKIKSSELSGGITKEQPSAAHFIAVIAFVFACLSLLACGALTYYTKVLLKKERARTTLTIGAFGKVVRGEDDEALRILTELKIVDKGDITPFEFAADIHRRNQQYQKALAEYELFFKLNPGREPSQSERSVMENDNARIVKGKGISQSEKSVPPREKDSLFDEFMADESKPIVKESAVVKREIEIKSADSKDKGVQTAREPVKPSGTSLKKTTGKDSRPSTPVKGLFIVDPDSLSYF